MSDYTMYGAEARTLNVSKVARMTEDEARQTFRMIRWADTDGEPVCPKCGCVACYEYASRPIFKCQGCDHQFTATSGTIFASRKLPIRDYLLAIALFVNGVTGISILQLGRDLDVQYRTAFMLAHKFKRLGVYPAHDVAPKPQDVLYPYLIHDQKSPGSELLMKINQSVPRGLPEQIRAEVCQDLAVAILSNEMKITDLDGEAKEFTRRVFQMFPTKWGPLSLDAPPPWGGDDRTLGEVLGGC